MTMGNLSIALLVWFAQPESYRQVRYLSLRMSGRFRDLPLLAGISPIILIKLTPFLPQRLRSLITLVIGLAGGVIATSISSPIPWLLGSLCATALAGFSGMTLAPISKFTSRWLRVVIGVSLGMFVAESLGRFSTDHSVAVLLALGFTLLVTALGAWFFRRTLQLDQVDSFISALPGGLSFLISLAGDLGQRFPRIGFIHTVRVVVLVFGFSFLALKLGASRPDLSISSSLHIEWHIQLLSLLAVILVSGWFADWVGVSGGHVIFGLMASTLAYKTGLMTQPVPELLITISMVGLGVLLGVELFADKQTRYARLAVASVVFTLGAMAIAGFIAWSVSGTMGTGFLLYLLALAPGGIAEISLITLALGLDVGLVAMAHACRFFLIMVIGPIGMNYFIKRSQR